jgi:hypothetical protein
VLNGGRKDVFAPISFFYKVSLLAILVCMESNGALLKFFSHLGKQNNKHGLCIGNEH